MVEKSCSSHAAQEGREEKERQRQRYKERQKETHYTVPSDLLPPPRFCLLGAYSAMNTSC